MFLCFPIIFIISISDTRSDRSLSVASSGKREGGGSKGENGGGRGTAVAWPWRSRTFQHLHGHGQRLVGLLLVDADGVGHDHLTEAALAQRLPQREPGTRARRRPQDLRSGPPFPFTRRRRLSP